MTDIHRFRGRGVPLPIDNVDTDQIIPAEYLKVTDKAGLGEGLFSRWRKRADGTEDPDFVLNRPEYRGASILVAGDNFGCGSSREHAPWALLEYGFRAVLSTRFADIFRNNSLKNGLLVITLDPSIHRRLTEATSEDPAAEIGIDLESAIVELPWGEKVGFEIDAFARRCLLDRVDQLGYLLQRIPAIESFESTRVPRVDSLARG